MIAYAAGNYNYKGKISANRDEIDSIIAGVNMLGEELLGTTVSRDYFSSIYNAVVEMVFILNSGGLIQSTNKAVGIALGYDETSVLNHSFNSIVNHTKKSIFPLIKEALTGGNIPYTIETLFKRKDNKKVFVSCSCSMIIDKNKKFVGYLIIANDITERKDTEKLILRTIVETQENEQKRVAVDLHDSLGQELSSVGTRLATLESLIEYSDKEVIRGLNVCKSMINNIVTNLRGICFDLAPGGLEEDGIVPAFNQLIRRLNDLGFIHYKFYCSNDFPKIPKQLEIMMYRIAQEFINNTIKHAKAKNIKLKLAGFPNKVILNIADDGIGFDLTEDKFKKGFDKTEVKSESTTPTVTTSITSVEMMTHQEKASSLLNLINQNK